MGFRIQKDMINTGCPPRHFEQSEKYFGIHRCAVE
jgi:hypothetical protein